LRNSIEPAVRDLPKSLSRFIEIRSVAQAARDLDIHENVLRKWVREHSSDPTQAFSGHGQMKPEQLEIERLRKEVAKLKAERDILKKRSRALVRLCAVETGRVTIAAGGELPKAIGGVQPR